MRNFIVEFWFEDGRSGEELFEFNRTVEMHFVPQRKMGIYFPEFLNGKDRFVKSIFFDFEDGKFTCGLSGFKEPPDEERVDALIAAGWKRERYD